MSYSTSNPPRLQTQPGLYAENNSGTTAGLGGRTWIYRTADVKSAVAVAGYFTNAVDLGFIVGDVVQVCDTTTPMVSLHRVTTVSTSGSAISAGLNIT